MMGVVTLAMPAGSLAAREASGSATISLIVPEVCNVSAGQFILTEVGLVVGSVQEFCNTSTGFQIVANHRPLERSEQAVVRYGGIATVLDSTGMAKVANRSGQRFQNVPVAISASALNTPLSIAFSVVAI
ncbi:hypothetical protein [Erythrobacter sp. R86502]|uniref:hypothetical protein n=1 Tax=Erythrobacter sp. R86502 TaxID=3093846 RepID=UPI0036D2211E